MLRCLCKVLLTPLWHHRNREGDLVRVVRYPPIRVGCVMEEYEIVHPISPND
jgi:hypothetical protein